MKFVFPLTIFPKTLLLCAVIMGAMSSISTARDPLPGKWNGVLNVQGTALRLVFHLKPANVGYKATMDSPDQGVTGIPASSVSFADQVLKITISTAGIIYEGTLKNDSLITGVFIQNGTSFSLNLKKATSGKEVNINRPQEPVPPFPYDSEEVYFENESANIRLAGTLTLPQQGSRFPAVVLISGSGPQNRDEELLGHKPFLVLADYLSRRGIAVFRYDDRGTSKSGGQFKGATTADFATDAAAAIDYLKDRKEINKSQIGLIGHSEGGLIAPMIASRDQELAFIILLAGPGMPGSSLLPLQQRLIGKAAGLPEEQLRESSRISERAFAIISGAGSQSETEQELSAVLEQAFSNIPDSQLPPGTTKTAFIRQQMEQLTDPWMRYFLTYDPLPALNLVKCPVLALNGSKDLQVPPRENLAAIKNALEAGGNKHVTIKELTGLNHLFQECETGSPNEYATIKQTFSPLALNEIDKWIKAQLK